MLGADLSSEMLGHRDAWLHVSFPVTMMSLEVNDGWSPLTLNSCADDCCLCFKQSLTEVVVKSVRDLGMELATT